MFERIPVPVLSQIHTHTQNSGKTPFWKGKAAAFFSLSNCWFVRSNENGTSPGRQRQKRKKPGGGFWRGPTMDPSRWSTAEPSGITRDRARATGGKMLPVIGCGLCHFFPRLFFRAGPQRNERRRCIIITTVQY